MRTSKPPERCDTADEGRRDARDDDPGRPASRSGLTLLSPIESVPGVGPRRGAAFRALGVASVAHLIDHIPFRHEREEAEGEIAALPLGSVGTARGTVSAARAVRSGRKRFEAVLIDDSGRLDLVWFNQPYLAGRIVPGMTLRVQGKAQKFGPGGSGRQMVNPRWEPLPDEPGGDVEAKASRVRPVYPASEALTSGQIDAVIGGCLDAVLPLLEDHLPPDFRRSRELPSLRDAYRMLHRPEHDDEPAEARRRLAFDELLMVQLAVSQRRARLRASSHAPRLRWDERIDARIRGRLPFDLTEGQEAVVRDLVADLTRDEPANRLIQGDVGSGKTAVALFAMLMAVASGKQAALLAPTEVLAEQHLGVISGVLAGADVRVELLTGSMPPADRDAVAARVRQGDADLVIGTHALLSGGVSFADLAVAVVDEQHRFGVHQRAALRTKAGREGGVPHTLVMTATPIPRTLAMTVFGDLDVSVLRGRPGVRVDVATDWIEPRAADAAWTAIRDAASRDERSFVVFPAIAEGDAEALRSVEWAMNALAEPTAGPLRGLRLEAMHGRLSKAERDQTMRRFRSGEAEVLISTTVIEVGVDVPEATLMVIDHAERFGLAQLHQLRGRVGRGEKPGRCILIGEASTEEAAARLRAVRDTADGFALAEADLALRGPGEVAGSQQSGLLGFRHATFPRDTDLLEMARRDAQDWVARSPELARDEERLLRSRLRKRVGSGGEVADVG